MYSVSYLIHVIGAIALLFYLTLPVLIRSAAGRGDAGQPQFRQLSAFNRIGQYVLILAFLTGGYMSSKAGVSIAWTIVSTVLILGMFALTGIMSKPLKGLAAGTLQGEERTAAAGKARKLGLINALLFVLLVLLMFNPTIL